MKTYKQLKAELEVILEAKQVGSLYHYTDFNSAKNILKDNKIKSNPYDDNVNSNKISTTRNKNFHKFNDRSIPTKISFELDGDEISKKHKTNPYHDSSIDKPYYKNKQNSESETQVKGDIHNAKKYIKKIRIHKNIHPEDLKELQSHNIPIEHVK